MAATSADSTSPLVRDFFDRFGEGTLFDDLSESHAQLVSRRIESVEFGEPDAIVEEKRAAANCKLLQQTLLHRAERLLMSSQTVLLEHNVYGMALMTRAHVETTAVLGYFCNRIESLTTKNISFEDFAWNVADALMGAKHEQFSEARAPINVLTCIEKTDKYLDRYFFNEKRGMLRDIYDWLSEFCHPNGLSNISAFKVDRAAKTMILEHGGMVKKEDFHVLHYLKISCEMFVLLFDAFAQQADAALPIKKA